MKRKARQRGLTLIELLVTVVILSFTVALMSGALGQIAQMLRVSTEHSNGFLGRWNQSRALYDMVANMVIDPTLERPMTGQPEQIDMVTLALPDGPLGVARPARLRLKTATDTDSTDLQLESLASQDGRPAMTLTRFPGRLEFRFIDHLGEEHAQWPPSGVAIARAMPSAVLLKDVDSQLLLVRAAAFEGALSPKNKSIAQAFGVGR
ncbi:MAG: type II secretion system protein [Hydrogenophaga sp.]|uniref:type II secretion system protein n=1 Tax=Hydrogenophaga sp. TaxID=1904254 RepID=UPI002ABC9915|nr:type II secretion system protein [Hydrogenophaga sp.]MDZ4187681.1 type II secretion system protein [Hydrogenophaga sp.]